MKQRAGRRDGTPLRSTPKGAYDGENVARKNHDIDLLGVQLESIRTNGECTNKLIENLADIVLKFSDEVRLLRMDNENLNIKLDHIAAAEFRYRASPSSGTTCHEGPHLLLLRQT
jgi:hypothetical protein